MNMPDVHLHPGDLGWYSRLGAVETASAIRIWAEGGAPAAIGLLDGPQLLRLAIDPTRRDDVGLARRIADSINDPKGGVFGPGQATVEGRSAGALTRILGQQGWQEDEPWVPLRLDLSAPVQPTRTLIETIDEDRGVPASSKPMGVHRDHRGRGYGVEITRAGAAMLREMGSSSAVVAAEGSNKGALATYRLGWVRPCHACRGHVTR